MGPAMLVTIGLLFLLQEARGGFFDFGNTYPVILIVVGAILLASSLAPRDNCLFVSGVPAGSGSAPTSTQNSAPGQGQ
jgi:hypothetical protein